MGHEHRRSGRALLAAISAVAAWLLVVAGGAALGQGVGAASPVPSAPAPSRTPVTSRDGIEVPTEAITPYLQCLLDAGEYIAEVHQPPVPGATPFFVLGITTDEETAFARAQVCRDTYAPFKEKTEAEVREIYAKWVDERECLIRLGYQPQEPPSVETFVETWWQTGPWMPIDGVPYSSWTDEEYRTAKVECGIEMYDR
jgi:hypothetical protein